MCKLLDLKAKSFIEEGRISEAFQTSQRIIRSSKCHKYSQILSQLISTTAFSLGSKGWYYAVEHCEDPVLLRQTLESQNALEPPVVMEKDQNPVNIDHLGMIRTAMLLGLQPTIENKTGKEIMGEAYRLQAEYFEKLILPSIQDRRQRREIKKTVDSFQYSSKLFIGDVMNQDIINRWCSSKIITVLYTCAIPNFSEARTRETVNYCKYDFLRMKTAWKLFSLEQGHEPESLKDLVPKYLASIPQDPFSLEGKEYGIKPFLYSLGPDQTDQKCEILYDPTNGTVTGGDVFLR